MTRAKKDKVKSKAKYYMWDNPYLWKYYVNQIIRRCVFDSKFQFILDFCYNYNCGGHFRPQRTTRKVFDSSYY